MTMISAVTQLTVAVALLVVLAGAAKNKCETRVSKFEKCLKKGYKPHIIESHVKVDRKFKGNEAKCLKIEKSVRKKCGSDYVYGTTEEPEINDWRPVLVRDEFNYIDYDLQAYPLEIKTNSTLGSNERVLLWFRTSGGEVVGGVYITFRTTPQYFLDYCMPDHTDFPTTLPSATNKVWRITVNRTSDTRLVVHCNEVEVLNILISSSTCSSNYWSYWNRDIAKISFRSDTASDYYRPYGYTVEPGWSEFGAWSECSESCDGGTQTRTRTCINPDHVGADCGDDDDIDTEARDCNTLSCPDCIKEGDDTGTGYRRNTAVSRSGLKCQRWDAQSPNEHTRTAANYPDSGLEENYCRNPDGESGLWCYNSQGTSPRWEYCDVPKCGEWTPIFNTTTDRYNVGDFHVKFTQHKTLDNYKGLPLYKGLPMFLDVAVLLYSDNGDMLGQTNYIFYARHERGSIEYSADMLFDCGGPVTFFGNLHKCAWNFKLHYLTDEGFNFEMITAVESDDMFQFIVSGEKHNVDIMANCTFYEYWQEMLEEASTAEMKLFTLVEDLPDYFTTEYRVVY